MNPISESLPVFDSIYHALDAIADLHRFIENAEPGAEKIYPTFFISPDFYSLAGEDLELDDFMVTRLSIDHEDVIYYKMLSNGEDIPYLTDFERHSLRPNLYGCKFLFRGQRKDYGTLKANLFRDDKKGYFLDDVIKTNELSAFIAMHPLVQLLGIKGFELLGKPMKFQCNLYGLAQHYYNNTVEIDFSSSLNVASFFAVTRFDKDSDCYIPLQADRESIGVIYVLPISTSLTHNRMYYDGRISSIGKQYCFERPARQLGFLVEATGGKDLISHPLLLKFQFKHNQIITNKIFENWDKGSAIAPSDPLETYWRKYRDIKGKPFDISNKAIELNLFKNPDETLDSIVSKILQYKEDNGEPKFNLTGEDWPKFPIELLEAYWQDIKNGWWEDVFCKNIYFPYDNGKKKEALINLPQDSRYKSAFYKSS